jgi:hypothetical protein
MKNSTLTASTLLEAVRQSLAQAGRYNAGDATAPAAILWTDADGQWEPIVAKLRPVMPELLTLGAYLPEQKTGPAIWLRCVIERVLPKVVLPDGTTPVIYMPRVSRQTLRAAEECPDELKPMVELQYRGAVWTQVNGKDWTVEAFLLTEDGGLGLDVARDQKTRQAMLGALPVLAATPVAALREKRLEAEDFDKLMIGDTQRDLLLWLSDPTGTRGEWDAAKWAAFCSRCRAEYGFDPEGDGEIVGGEKLGMRQDHWSVVWQRFTESPSLYPGIPDLLRRSKPTVLIFDKEPWPDENAKAEDAVRAELLGLSGKSAAEARVRVVKLESDHALRRDWVWARLGLAPLAEAVQHLAVLAANTEHALGGDTAEHMAELYAKGGFLADDAALKALAAVKSAEDVQAVTATLRALYLPWLDDSARNFQKVVGVKPLPDAAKVRESPTEYLCRQCVVFCDGLRFDLAQRVVARAEERGLRVQWGRRWAALPTVTATAKPAVSPIADGLAGAPGTATFEPIIHGDGAGLTTDRFRHLLADKGYQVLAQTDVGDPRGEDGKAWTEFGEIDRLGHTLQGKLALRLDEHLEMLVDRVVQLLDAGWKSVKLVTDHGWLLLPGGLPDVKLPKYLTESRWSRCAAIKAGARVDVPTARWHWDAGEAFAYPPGVHCFGKGNEYAHGGVSLQECLIPELTLSSDRAANMVAVAVKDIQWMGQRCRVVIEPAAPGLLADLRTKPNDAGASVASPKSFDAEGRAGVLVEDDGLAGTVVSLVVLDASGRVIAKQTTTIGGET